MTQSLPIATSAVNVPSPSGGEDTAAIQSLLNANGTLVFPDGNYKIGNLTITRNGQVFRGNGIGRTTFTGMAGGAMITVANNVSRPVCSDFSLAGGAIADYGILLSATASGVRGVFRDIEISGVTGTAGTAIAQSGVGFANVDQSFSLRLDRVECHDNRYGVALVKRVQNSTLRDCLIYGNSLGQVIIGDGSQAVVAINLYGCQIEMYAGAVAQDNLYVNWCNSLKIDGSYFETTVAGGFDIHIAGANASSLLIENPYSAGNSLGVNSMKIDVASRVAFLGGSIGGFTGAIINDVTGNSQITHLYDVQGATTFGLQTSDLTWTGRPTAATKGVPTAAAGTASGATPPAPIVVSAAPGSNDSAGRITFGTGTAPTAGQQVVVTFGGTYANAPKAVIVNWTGASQGLGAIATGGVTNTGFAVYCGTAPAASQANNAYAFYYTVIW